MFLPAVGTEHDKMATRINNHLSKAHVLLLNGILKTVAQGSSEQEVGGLPDHIIYFCGTKNRKIVLYFISLNFPSIYSSIHTYSRHWLHLSDR